MANLQFTLDSGRKLGLTAFGVPTARRVVIFCHGAPGSSDFDPNPTASVDADVHILAFDRPGYGSSEPLPPGRWPSVSGAADDIAEYLHSAERAARTLGQHELDSVGVVGWSAGGRVALALAARHPDLVDRVAVVATPAPNDEVRWIDPELSRISERMAMQPPDDAVADLTNLLAAEVPGAAGPSDFEAQASLSSLGATDADAGALEYPGAIQRLEGMLRDAFRHGAIGLACDILAYTARPWGFDLSDVEAKTLLLYGEADAVAGRAHAQWYRKQLADARVEMVPGVGHLLIIPTWERVLAFVHRRDRPPAGTTQPKSASSTR
ncbi:MAG: alpha/beta hydrolase [Microbacteriaceae bacterium]